MLFNNFYRRTTKSLFIIIIFLFFTGIIYSQKQDIRAGQTYESSVTVGELVYYTGTQWDETDASSETAASTAMVGIALGNSQVLIRGSWKTTGLTSGSKYYMSTTAGQITITAPPTVSQVVRVIGYALSSTELNLDVDNTWIVR